MNTDRHGSNSLVEVLDRLEAHYGPQTPGWPTDPYEFIVWWHCGYPASDAACAKGWAALHVEIGHEPQALLDASPKELGAALKAGGMVPELRALRLKEIAARAGELGGSPVRKALKKFPNIADPGADRILLFAGLEAVAAVPSNCPHVVVRILRGKERLDYGRQYREAQGFIESGVPGTVGDRQRAFLLLKQHGQTFCKRVNPRCGECPVSGECAVYGRGMGGRLGS
jgi:endonuclease-3